MMPFLKKIEICDLSSKYGQKQRGAVALEPIKKGEQVFACDLSICNYYHLTDPRNKMTKVEVLALMEANPEAADFIRKYTYMVGDDKYNVPRDYKTQEITEACALINHSCDPNTGYGCEEEDTIVALCDIKPGQELTYDYGLMDSEDSLWVGFICHCGAANCKGELKFDSWRDPAWQAKYEQYAGAHIKRKIKQLHEHQQQQ